MIRNGLFLFSAPYTLRLTLCAMRDVEATMPAIAPIEDLKSAQKEGVSIYAMLYALCEKLVSGSRTIKR